MDALITLFNFIDAAVNSSKEEIDYNKLTDLPKINGVTMIGDKTPDAYGLQEDMDETSALEIINLWNNIN